MQATWHHALHGRIKEETGATQHGRPIKRGWRVQGLGPTQGIGLYIAAHHDILHNVSISPTQAGMHRAAVPSDSRWLESIHLQADLTKLFCNVPGTLYTNLHCLLGEAQSSRCTTSSPSIIYQDQVGGVDILC